MDGTVTASLRRSRSTTLLATVLCACALLAPVTAQTATGGAQTGSHVAKIVAVGSTQQQLPALRPDQPHPVTADDRHVLAWSRVTRTATSAMIAPSRTADSPRMRGPPAHGCC